MTSCYCWITSRFAVPRSGRTPAMGAVNFLRTPGFGHALIVKLPFPHFEPVGSHSPSYGTMGSDPWESPGAVGRAPIVKWHFRCFWGGLSGCGRTRQRSGSDDLAHGVVEAHLENVDEEVDGIALEVALGPAPIAFFDDETGKGG